MHWPKHTFIITAIISLYLIFAIGRAVSTEPWNDEAWYASPSLSLIEHGNTGTPYLETSGHYWKGINEKTYWVMPLPFFLQVPWIEVAGFNLFSMRMYATAWGVLAMLCWGAIVWLLTKDASAALLTMLFLACDYQYVSQMAIARPEGPALGFASLAILFYIYFREKHIHLAIFLSNLAVAACGLTHPVPLMPVTAAIVVLTIGLDWERLRWIDLLALASAYAIGFVFLFWYIGQSPDLFQAQFIGNATETHRFGGLLHPWQSIGGEMGRYVKMAGWGTGMPVAYRVKIIVMFVYVLAVASAFLTKAFRTIGTRILLVLWATYFLVMAFVENTKDIRYAVHLIPTLASVTAVWLVTVFRNGQRWVSVMCVTCLLAVGIGGLAYTSVMKDDYHHRYLPAARFLQKNAGPGDLILAGSEFGFVLGFDRKVTDDNNFTYFSRKQPVFVVMSHGYRDNLEHDRIVHPEIATYFTRMLSDYRLVYSHGDYQIFKRI